MKIYTVTSTDDPDMEPLDRCIAGSYTTRGRALDECVDYIMERIGNREDIAWSMAHDENHPEAAKFFSERKKDGLTVVRKGCVGKLRVLLRDYLGGDGCYYVYDGASSWHFDVDENDVEGELWHTVTWGDSDCEDPTFTTPWTNAFTSQKTAVGTFVNYVRDLCGNRGERFTSDMEKSIRAQFKAFKQVKMDLDDGCCVNCVLYRDNAENVKE